MFNYFEGEVIELVAEAEEGYCFVDWTGDVSTIADVKDATTTITVNGGYSITTNFAEYILVVAAGEHHTVGLCSNSTVVAVGDNTCGQ